MKNDVRLYIEDKEIEFNIDPKILFNYKITDITNPSIVKNSFSKTVEIEGTPNNNKVFQNIWNLERVQWAGIDFNPLKKADFTLYINGEIYEKGYAKLDSVTMKNNKCSYSITLFGGLGSFFYSLSYGDDEGTNKKTLADLKYGEREQYGDDAATFQPDPDLEFQINKESLWDAWQQVIGSPDAVYDEEEVDRPNNYFYDEKWNVINFAPCYNGVPDDFEAAKCLINTNNMPVLEFSKTDGGVNYGPYNGYIMGEQPNDDLTEWMTYDLRSYLQRPVINFKRVIDACCNPENNGGFEVKLDKSFFNYDNPYYENAWLTLPMLRENIEGGEITTNTEASISIKDSSKAVKRYNINYDTPTISKISNVKMGLRLLFSANITSSTVQPYLYKKIRAYYGEQDKVERIDYTEQISSVSIQLAAYDAFDKCVAASDVYFITDKEAKGKTDFYKNVPWTETGVPVNSIKSIYGRLKYVASGSYELVDDNDNPILLGFSFGNNVPYTRLELLVCPTTYNYSRYLRPYKWWKGGQYNSYQYYSSFSDMRVFTIDGLTYGGNLSVSNSLSMYAVPASVYMTVTDFNLVQQDYAEFFTDTLIPKKELLNTEHSPAEYLISYAKMFGLHFYRDPAEQAPNPETAPNGVIHIMTRDTFYNEEVVDLEDYIDRNKGIKMNPTTSDSKWFNFNITQTDSEANKEYKDKFNNDYGYQKINTGYNFNASNKALLDKVVFKGGIEALETSKYYQRQIEGYPAYGWNGFVYTLFNTEEADLRTLEVDDGLGRIYRLPINPNGWEDTDAFKKPQFHTKDNSSSDGKDVLLFLRYGAFYADSFNYWLTDDLPEMVALNDGKPCWIMTAEETNTRGGVIAYRIKTLPVFERNLVYNPTSTYVHSWDMGVPQLTFVRDIYASEDATIYDKCWKDYISDLYSQDNRTLTAYVVFKERPNANWLRRYYWFDNCFWRINTIKDWNVASYEPTMVEFVKVIDRDNYKLEEIRNYATIKFGFTNLTDVSSEYDEPRTTWYTTDYRDKQGILSIDTGNAGGWSFSDSFTVEYAEGYEDYYEYGDYLTPNNTSGYGSAIKQFHITENDSVDERTFRLSISDDSDTYYFCNIIQEGKPETEITFNPSVVYGPADGGVVEVEVLYAGRGDDGVFTDNNESIDWFTYSLGAWNGDKAILTITFTPNDTGVTRTGGYIQLSGIDSGYTESISVNQLGGVTTFIFTNLEINDEQQSNEYIKSYKMGYGAQNATAVINVGDAGSWAFGDGANSECMVTYDDGSVIYYPYRDIMTPNNDVGEGNAVKVFAIPENPKTYRRRWDIRIIDNTDRYYYCFIIQDGKP